MSFDDKCGIYPSALDTKRVLTSKVIAAGAFFHVCVLSELVLIKGMSFCGEQVETGSLHGNDGTLILLSYIFFITSELFIYGSLKQLHLFTQLITNNVFRDRTVCVQIRGHFLWELKMNWLNPETTIVSIRNWYEFYFALVIWAAALASATGQHQVLELLLFLS